MNVWAKLESVLRESSDPDNPGAERIFEIMRATKRIAVVGISRDATKVARRIPSYLAAKGFSVVPVNPFATRILGQVAHASLDEVTQRMDMILLFRPSDQVGPFIRQAAARPERPVIWLQEGIRSDPEAGEARAQGSTVVQDLCIYKVHRVIGEDADQETDPI
jgi:predicted CoA-binding protein